MRACPWGPLLAPSTVALEVGTNRFAFALRDRANKQLAGAAVAVYTTDKDGSHVRGPYLARSESLRVKPAYQSETTARDPAAARSLYVAKVPLRAGQKVITGVARLDGRLVATSGVELPVRRRGIEGQVPDVGQKAIPVRTDDLVSAGGEVTKVTTRAPPAKSLVDTQFLDVLGRKPVVLQFSTPLLCQSRVCGPVADVLAQVQAQTGDKAAFIQQEIYRNNDVNQGFRTPVIKWRPADGALDVRHRPQGPDRRALRGRLLRRRALAGRREGHVASALGQVLEVVEVAGPAGSGRHGAEMTQRADPDRDPPEVA